MGASSENPGVASDLAQQASRKIGEVGHWLENNEPEAVLDELRSFARRRPGAFLIGAGLAGVVVGRLTRNLGSVVKADREASDTSASYGTTGTYAAESYPATTYPATGYSDTTVTGYSAGVESEGLGTSSVDPLSETSRGAYGRGDVTP
jgi:hypothetical protein